MATPIGALTLVAGSLVAGARFASPSGTGTWAAAQEIVTPCSLATAAANATAGTTTYFRGGTYDVGASWGDTPSRMNFSPANNGTIDARITFMAYPDEVPILQGTGYLCGAVADYPGESPKTYITFDGFRCVAADPTDKASIYYFGTIGCEFLNMDVWGPDAPVIQNDNYDGIRVDNSGYAVVRGCTVRNFLATQTWGDYSHNAAGIKLYHNNEAWIPGGGHITIENNEIFNSVVGVYVKSSTSDCVIRNNYIHDVESPVLVTPQVISWYAGTEKMFSDRGLIYNNLFTNRLTDTHSVGVFAAISMDSQADADGDSHGDDWEIYNNTSYTFGGMGITDGSGYKYYNNIWYTPVAADMCFYNQHGWGTLAEEDHNQLGVNQGKFYWVGYNLADTYTLAEWQASTLLEDSSSPGVDDLQSDPKFLNTTGNLNTPDDFALANDSPCKASGRASADMGCNVATIGTGTIHVFAPADPLPDPVPGEVWTETEEINDPFSSDTAGNYAITWNSGAAALSVSGGAMHITGANQAASFYHKTALSSLNQYVQANIQWNSTTPGYSCLSIRGTNAGVSYYCYVSPEANLGLSRNGTWLATIKTGLTTGTHTLKMQVTGVDATVKLTVTLDAETPIVFEDTYPERLVTGSYVGAKIDNQNGTDLTLDNFVAGTVAVA